MTAEFAICTYQDYYEAAANRAYWEDDQFQSVYHTSSNDGRVLNTIAAFFYHQFLSEVSSFKTVADVDCCVEGRTLTVHHLERVDNPRLMKALQGIVDLGNNLNMDIYHPDIVAFVEKKTA